MATVTYNIGHIEDDNGMVVNVQSVHPPFQKGVGLHTDEYLMSPPPGISRPGYSSGDTLVFSIAGTDKIRTAIFTTSAGAIKTYTESDFASSAGTGKILTVTSVTTDLHTFIVFDT